MGRDSGDERPTGTVGPWLRLTMAALMTLVSGCTCSSSKSGADPAAIEAVRQRLAEEAEQEEAEAKKAQEEKAAQMVARRSGARVRPASVVAAEKRREEEGRLAADAAAEAAALEAVRRPDEVADWVKKDYCSAREQGDPRLIEAVEHLGERFVGNASAAQLLRSLLKPVGAGPRQPVPEDPDDESEDAPRHATVMNAALTEAIVTALMVNGTDAARQTVKELLAGTLPTDNVRMARETALAALGRYPHPDNEMMLFWALTQAAEHPPAASRPGRPRTPDERSAEQEAARMEAEILDALRTHASEKVRVLMAQHIGGPFVPARRRELILQFLLEPDPRNLGAQVVLFEDFDTPKELKETLEQYFIVHGSATLRRLLEIPETTPGGRFVQAGQHSAAGNRVEQAARNDPDLAARVARELWSDHFLNHVLGELHHIDSLVAGDPTVVLAATMPFDPIRSKVQETLNRNWQDGPAVLERIDQRDDLFVDPALLVALKMVPRELPSLAELMKKRSFGGRFGRRDGNSDADELAEARQERARIREAWLKVSGRLILSICGELERASRARDARDGLSTPPAAPDSITAVPLHENARIVAWYRIRLPRSGGESEAASRLGLLEVDYVRIEEVNQLAKVARHYQHRLRSSEVYHSDRGTWFDALESLPDTGRTRSTDVLITRGEKGLPGKADEAERLSIEILSVEVNTPKAGG